MISIDINITYSFLYLFICLTRLHDLSINIPIMSLIQYLMLKHAFYNFNISLLTMLHCVFRFVDFQSVLNTSENASMLQKDPNKNLVQQWFWEWHFRSNHLYSWLYNIYK